MQCATGFLNPTGATVTLTGWQSTHGLTSTLYGAYARFKDWWANYNNFFAQFRVTGFRWAAVELLSEAATLGTGALAIVLMFQLPTIELTKNPNWRTGSEFSVTFLDRYGNEVGKRGILYSDAVPFEEIPDTLLKATMATEDRRFYDHFGIDVLGTLRAIVENARANEVVQGGSSLTQQLAKNLFLSSERSIQRKIKEVYLALWLEAHLTKKEIFKLYLDRAYLGGGTFGVEAASQFYFGKSVRDINLAEAVLLAGLFKAPTKYAPHSNPVEFAGACKSGADQSCRCRVHDRRAGSRREAKSCAGRGSDRGLRAELFPRLGL